MINKKLQAIALNQYKNIISDAINHHIENNNIKILDVGAGNCSILFNYNLKYYCVGIDFHEHQHFINNTFLTFISNSNSNFMFSDALGLPFKDNTFDIVYSNEFVSHVSNIDKFIDEQIRVLKKRRYLYYYGLKSK